MGALDLQNWTLQDWAFTDEFAGVDVARPNIARLYLRTVL